MQKVKVQRYVAGKRPKYAQSSDNEEEISEESVDEQEEEAKVTRKVNNQPDPNLIKQNAADDRRLQRLNEIDNDTPNRNRTRQRHIVEPVILMEEEEADEEGVNEIKQEIKEESDEEEIDEDERIRRRMEMKKRALQRQEV